MLVGNNGINSLIEISNKLLSLKSSRGSKTKANRLFEEMEWSWTGNRAVEHFNEVLDYLYQRLSILKKLPKNVCVNSFLTFGCLSCDIVRRTSFAGRPCDFVPRETPQTIRDLFHGETLFSKETMRTRLLHV